ncbi:hypothetical protein Tco_1540632 [Tanacetum coccineum]
MLVFELIRSKVLLGSRSKRDTEFVKRVEARGSSVLFITTHLFSSSKRAWTPVKSLLPFSCCIVSSSISRSRPLLVSLQYALPRALREGHLAHFRAQRDCEPGVTFALDMSNSDELRHTDNTTLIPPRSPTPLPPGTCTSAQHGVRPCEILSLLLRKDRLVIDVKPRVEESSLETLSVDELITQLRHMCGDAENHASNAQDCQMIKMFP